MHNLISCILRMEDYTEVMPVILYYFAIDWVDANRVKQASEELDEAINALEEIARFDYEKSGIISYYLHELRNSKKRVKKCINIAQ